MLGPVFTDTRSYNAYFWKATNRSFQIPDYLLFLLIYSFWLLKSVKWKPELETSLAAVNEGGKWFVPH